MSNRDTSLVALGPASLSSIALCKLRQFSHILGDIGSIPLTIIGDVLVECSAETLSRIETETAVGVCQRDISGETWPLWYIHVKNELRNTIKKNDILRQCTISADSTAMEPLSSLRHLVDTDVPVLNYRGVYQEIIERKRRRLDNAGQHVRKRFQEEENRKLSRRVQVIDPIPSTRRKETRIPSNKSTTGTLSQKLGIKTSETFFGKKSTTAFRRNQRSMIKKHRSQGRPRLPTVTQLKQQGVPQVTKKKTLGTLSEASLFHE